MFLVFIIFGLSAATAQDVDKNQTINSSDLARPKKIAVNWDRTASLRMATIKDDVRESIDGKAQGSFFYSSDGRLILMPLPPYMARLQSNRDFPETNSRRPDAEILNWTASMGRYRQQSLGYRNRALNPSLLQRSLQPIVPRVPLRSQISVDSRGPWTASALVRPQVFGYPQTFYRARMGPNNLRGPPFSLELQNTTVPLGRHLPPRSDLRQRVETLPISYPILNNYFQSDIAVREIENAIVPSQYPVFNPSFVNDEIPTIHILVRPPYTDREIGSENFPENLTANNDTSPEIEEESSQKTITKRNDTFPKAEQSVPREKVFPMENPVSPDFFPVESPFTYNNLPTIFSVFTPETIPMEGFQEFPGIPPQRFQDSWAPNPGVEYASDLPFRGYGPQFVPLKESYPEAGRPEAAREISQILKDSPKEENIQRPLTILGKNLEAISDVNLKTLETPPRLPYEFGYRLTDGQGSGQTRQESSDSAGVVTGKYSYTDPLGLYRVVEYVADQNGFRATVSSNEPGVADPGSANVVVRAEAPPETVLAAGQKEPQLIAVAIPAEDEFDVGREQQLKGTPLKGDPLKGDSLKGDPLKGIPLKGEDISKE